MAEPVLSPDQRAAIRKTAKDGDLDRYTAALFAPGSAHDQLMTVAALNGELARIPLAVSEPLLGEIRLQWWRDAVAQMSRGEKTGHPIADALAGLISSHSDLREQVLHVIDLYAAFNAALAIGDFDNLLKQSVDIENAIFNLAAASLEQPAVPDAAGQAFGSVQFLRKLPPIVGKNSAAGFPVQQVTHIVTTVRTAARSALSDARQALNLPPKRPITVLLPLALVEPYLRVLESPGHDATRAVTDIAPLTRLWRLQLAMVRGQI